MFVLDVWFYLFGEMLLMVACFGLLGCLEVLLMLCLYCLFDYGLDLLKFIIDLIWVVCICWFGVWVVLIYYVLL